MADKEETVTEQKTDENKSVMEPMKEEKKVDENETPHDPNKLLRTVLMDFAWICMGLFSEVIGPTLPWLKAKTNSNYEEISRALMATGLGGLVGSILGGLFTEKLLKQLDLYLGISMLLGAVAAFSTPYMGGLIPLGFMLLLDGIGKGFMATSTNAYMMKLWGDKAAVPNHSLHFSFGIGAVLAPQLARPFIGKVPTNGMNDPNATREYLLSLDVQIPYNIVACLTFLSAFIFFITYCFYTPCNYQTKPIRELMNVFSNFSNNKIISIFIALLLMVFFALAVGEERIYGKFIYVFSTEGDCHFTSTQGTVLETLFWTSFTMGRGFGTILAYYVPPLILLTAELAVHFGASFILAIQGNGNANILWSMSTIYGATLSPLIPACISWINLHIELSAMIMSMVYVSIGIAGMIFVWMMGYLYEVHGPPVMMPTECVTAFFICVTFVALAIVVKYGGKREDKQMEYKQL